jgi:hypothetical protein
MRWALKGPLGQGRVRTAFVQGVPSSCANRNRPEEPSGRRLIVYVVQRTPFFLDWDVSFTPA